MICVQKKYNYYPIVRNRKLKNQLFNYTQTSLMCTWSGLNLSVHIKECLDYRVKHACMGLHLYQYYVYTLRR